MITSHLCLAYLSILLFLLSLHTNFIRAQDPEATAPPFHEGDEDFLFVGNSYTAQNDLSTTFKNVAKAGFPEHADNIQTIATALGGKNFHYWSLEIEKEDDSGSRPGKLLRQVLRTDPIPLQWVTLQEQSQTPSFITDHTPGSIYDVSLQSSKVLNYYAQGVGARTMFYMTWGRYAKDHANIANNPDYLTMQENIKNGYFKYVEENSTPERPTYVAPVGLVFKRIYDDLVAEGKVPNPEDGTTTPFGELYVRDGSHPSVRGTYVAALTIFTAMYGKDPESMTWWPDDFDETIAKTLQNAISRTVLETFESGLILYPWTTSWTGSTSGASGPAPSEPATTEPAPSEPATTEPPTTEPATSEPTTSAPGSSEGNANGSANGNANGNSNAQTVSPSATQVPSSVTIPPEDPSATDRSAGSITIEIQYDDYPQDIAWTLMKKGTASGAEAGEVLHFQPFNSLFTPGANQMETFSNLTLNEIYSFKIYDHQGDGICCSFGEGYVKILDNTNIARSGTILFDLGETLGSYYELDMAISDAGPASVSAQSDAYLPGTWPELFAVDSSIEPEWPGPYPSEDASSIVINIDLDDNPQDIMWELYRFDNVIQSWNGSTASAGSLNSTELTNLQNGWYRFIVTDRAMNGLSNGYITILGPLAVFQAKGLIWGSDGQFGEQAVVKFQMDESGYVSKVEWEPNEVTRTQAPIRNGTQTETPSKTPPPLGTQAPTIDSDELTVTLQPVSTQPPAGTNGTETTPPPGANGTGTSPAPVASSQPTPTTAPTNASTPAPSSSSLPPPRLSHLAFLFLVGTAPLFSFLA